MLNIDTFSQYKTVKKNGKTLEIVICVFDEENSKLVAAVSKVYQNQVDTLDLRSQITSNTIECNHKTIYFIIELSSNSKVYQYYIFRMHHSLNGVEDSNFMCTPEETSNNDVETIQEKYQSNKRKVRFIYSSSYATIENPLITFIIDQALEEIFIEDLDDKPLPTLNHSFSSKPEDEIDYFMCSLANSIKKFSPDLKRNIKIDLLRLVNEYEKKHENESSKQAYFPAYSQLLTCPNIPTPETTSSEGSAGKYHS